MNEHIALGGLCWFPIAMQDSSTLS